MYTTSLISALILALDIYAIYLVLTGGSTAGYKVLWILLILFLPLVGMVLYFLFGRSTFRSA